MELEHKMERMQQTIEQQSETIARNDEEMGLIRSWIESSMKQEGKRLSGKLIWPIFANLTNICRPLF